MGIYAPFSEPRMSCWMLCCAANELPRFVILTLSGSEGEESTRIPACGRAAGFFAKPQNDTQGAFIGLFHAGRVVV